MNDSERIFRLLRRRTREKDVVVRLGKLPEGTCGECIVVITLDPHQIKESPWSQEEVLAHELLHAHCFAWSENTVRRLTKRLMRSMSEHTLARLTRVVKKLSY